MRWFFAILMAYMGQSLATPLQVDGYKFRTQEGEHFILRGINVAGNAKVPPFRAIHRAEDLKPLRGLGFNSIRLLFTWEAFEPERGVYDWDYLHDYLQVVKWAADADLLVIADIHQDAFSRFSIGGCGEGFPYWTLPPAQKLEQPDNGKNCENWGVRMIFDLSMHNAWHHFYANTHGIRQSYLEMMRTLAAALADSPNVIGFDLLNEPWGIEDSEIPALYSDAGAIVLREMPGAILFLSSHALTSAGIFPSKLPPLPLANTSFSAHYYDPGLQFNTWTSWALNTSNGHWKNVIKKWQKPLFLGEFGASVKLAKAVDYVSAIYDLMDAELYSGAQWVYTPEWNDSQKDGWNHEDFSIVDGQGQLRGTYRPRPFVEQAEDILKMKWEESSKTLTVTYTGRHIRVNVPSRLSWLSTSELSNCKIERTRLDCESLSSQERARTVSFQFSEEG